jgi:cytochrome c oxidase subunit 1
MVCIVAVLHLPENNAADERQDDRENNYRNRQSRLAARDLKISTLLTVFTICASVEIAGRLRGGKGMLGWITVLPWGNPVMLSTALSFVMLGFGGAGGLINMSYQLNSTIHNTQWVTGHFHLIFGGAIVIMYFIIAYDVWPHLTGRALDSLRLMRMQLWLWFVGMMVLTLPWHYVGILGMPRRMAFHDYTDPAIAAQAP